MFSSVEDVELEEIEHAAGILLDGHSELVLVLRDLLRELPLQYGAWPDLSIHTVLDLHLFNQLLAQPKALNADFTFVVNLSTMDGSTHCFVSRLKFKWLAHDDTKGDFDEDDIEREDSEEEDEGMEVDKEHSDKSEE